MISQITARKFGNLREFTGVDIAKTPDLLRGTPFWEKRKTLTALQMRGKPAYRMLSIMYRLAPEYGITPSEWDSFLLWATDYITLADRQLDPVKQFHRRYGDYRHQRTLLTVKNLIDLYLFTFYPQPKKDR